MCSMHRMYICSMCAIMCICIRPYVYRVLGSLSRPECVKLREAYDNDKTEKTGARSLEVRIMTPYILTMTLTVYSTVLLAI